MSDDLMVDNSNVKTNRSFKGAVDGSFGGLRFGHGE